MKKLEKKLILGSAAALMAMGSVSTVLAEDVVTTANTIDTTKTGSITLVKLQSEDGKSKDGTGLRQDLTDVGGKGIAGVKFNYIKVGELAQIDTALTAGMTQAGVYYTLTPDFKAQLKAVGVNIRADVTGADGAEYFIADTVNEAMRNVNNKTVGYGTDKNGTDVANEQFIKFAKNKGVAMNATDATGKTEAKNLGLGLYLVAEVESPAHVNNGVDQSIAKAARPFLVSLPMTNIATITEANGTTHEAGTVWQYDVTAYPKNEMITIRKDIIADGNDTVDGANTNGLVQTTNKNVGDYINFLLTLDLPKLQDKTNSTQDNNTYRKYIITDTMSKGLTLDDISGNNFKLSFGTGAWNSTGNTALVHSTDYTIVETPAKANGDHDFVITLTQSGLAKFDQMSKDAKLYVNYKARLNKDAVSEKTGAIKEDSNKTNLVFGTSTSRDYSFDSNPDIRAYTYEINVTKTFSHTVDDMSPVSFTIKGLKDDGSGDYEQVKFIKEADGVYHKYDGKEVAENSAAVITEVHCSEGGKLILKGLDARMYVFTEENTVKGYNLMRDTITVNFDDDYRHNGKVDMAEIASGKYVASNAVAIRNVDLDKGVVSFGIKNNETIEALHTGGDGWSNALMAMGMTAIVAGGAIFLFKRKKEEEQA